MGNGSLPAICATRASTAERSRPKDQGRRDRGRWRPGLRFGLFGHSYAGHQLKILGTFRAEDGCCSRNSDSRENLIGH